MVIFRRFLWTAAVFAGLEGSCNFQCEEGVTGRAASSQLAKGNKQNLANQAPES